MYTGSLLFALFCRTKLQGGREHYKVQKLFYLSAEAYYRNINICHRMLKNNFDGYCRTRNRKWRKL